MPNFTDRFQSQLIQWFATLHEESTHPFDDGDCLNSKM